MIKEYINLLGTGLVIIVLTKYNVDIPRESYITDIQRLTNQLWKIIPMRENNEPWLKQLNTVLLEIVGLSELFAAAPQFLQLISKLEGLSAIGADIEFELFRKTVFEALSLLSRLKDVGNTET